MDITRNIPSHLGECSSPGCAATAGPLPGPQSGRDLCPEHRDDERHELEWVERAATALAADGLNTRDVRELIEDRMLASAGLYRPEALLRVAREELAAAEHHLTLARQIKADGNGAHSVPYWEREVARLRAKVADLEAPAGCPECGRTTPPITELGAKFCAGDFCSGPLPSPAGPAYWCKKCRKAVNGTIRADSEPPHFQRHYLTAGPDRGMACGPVVQMCEQCGAAGAITVTDAGDFCACGAEVTA